ncbi:MAG: hypothetical protein AB7O45_04840, partial [Alphaproteobacteria bacterium]
MSRAAGAAPGLRIRRAMDGDATALARLGRAMSRELRETVSKFTAAAARRDVLGPRRIVDAVVAERDGRLVGF